MIEPVIMLHIALGGAVAGALLTGALLWYREWSWLSVSVPGLLLGLSLGLLLAVPLIEAGRSLRSLPAMAVAGLIWLPPTYVLFRKIRQAALTSN